jgi:hypothetical protein
MIEKPKAGPINKETAMSSGRAGNKAYKNSVPSHRASNFAKNSSFDAGTADAVPAPKPNKDAQMSEGRNHTLASKKQFCGTDCDM